MPVRLSQTSFPVNWLPASLLAAASFCLSGCITSPKQQMESELVSTPGAWSSVGGPAEAFVPESWTRDFSDERLVAILQEAYQFNHDLRVAVSRMDAALAGSRANRSDILPSLSVSGSGTKSRRSGASGISQTLNNETYGLNARFAWEIDLWGRIRNGYRAELAETEAALADYSAARLSLGARVAKAWYNAVEANQQFELEKRILEALSESSRIVEESFASGISGALDVRLIRANLASSRSSLEQRRRSRDAAIRNLETLLGRYPKTELDVVAEFPDLKDSPSVGLPSDLLLRRPDVIAAERRLAAAEQRQFESSKARLPNVSLNLSRGTSAEDTDGIFELVDNRIWSQSLTVAETLFQGGRLKANYRRAKALYEQEVATYAGTVLTAFREVETALANQDSFTADYDALKVAVEESVAAEKLAWEEYSRGLSDITTVLDSVRRSISAQRSFIQVANQRIQSRIDLYLALGGGFETDQPSS